MLLTIRAYIEGCARAWRLGRHANSTARSGIPIPEARQAGRRLRRPDDARRQGAVSPTSASSAPTSRCRSTAATATSANTGMEQFVRDARISQIYEGTNGIQALTWSAASCRAHGPLCCARFFHPGRAIHDRRTGNRRWPSSSSRFSEGVRARCSGDHRVADARGMANPDEAGAAATDTCACSADGAGVPVGPHGGDRQPRGNDELRKRGVLQAKLRPRASTCRSCCRRPGALLSSILAGSKPLMAMDEAAF